MPAVRGRPRKQTAVQQLDLYSAAFAAELAAVFARARELDDLSQEIAILRVELYEAVREGAAAKEICRIVDAISRAASAAARLPQADSGAVLARVSEELSGILALLADGGDDA